MSDRLTDTRPEAAAAHEALIRAAGTRRRAEMTRTLSSRVRLISWRALKRRYPEASDRELALRFAALVYGDDTARKIGEYVARRPE